MSAACKSELEEIHLHMTLPVSLGHCPSESAGGQVEVQASALHLALGLCITAFCFVIAVMVVVVCRGLRPCAT